MSANLVEADVRVELLDEAADGDAGVLGGRGKVGVGVRQPHELRHVRHAAQLVAQVVEHPRYQPRPGGRFNRIMKLANCPKMSLQSLIENV